MQKLTPALVRRTARELHREGGAVNAHTIARRIDCSPAKVASVIQTALGLVAEVQLLDQPPRSRIPPNMEWIALPWLADRLNS